MLHLIYCFLDNEDFDVLVGRRVSLLYAANGKKDRCCNLDCLPSRFNRKQITEIVSGCLNEVKGKQLQKRDYLLSKVRSMIRHVHTSGRYSYNWSIGLAPYSIPKVCSRTFQICYNIGHTCLTDIVNSVS